MIEPASQSGGRDSEAIAEPEPGRNAHSPALLPVELDGRFRLEEAIGSGGMAHVYRATDQMTGQVVAIKILTALEQNAQRRFEREAALLASLDHPAIVRYVAQGIAPTRQPYIAMEWIAGEDLRKRLQRGPLAATEAVELGRRVATALAAAHERGVIHRDIKPSNIALPHGRIDAAVVLDFGIAHLRDTSLTVPGERIGTPTYMAPEQVLGLETIGPGADVFALGCVLFECLTGKRAFAARDAVALHAKVLMEELPRLGGLVPSVTRPLERLVADMLAKKPSDRPRDGRELLAELDEIAAGTALAGSSRRLLSGSEQVIVSVIVATHLDRLSVRLAHETLPAHRARQQDDSLISTLRDMGVGVERLADGSVIATVAGAGAPADRATQAARVALALRRKLPGLGVVLATGHTPRDRPTMGDVIDRAVDLLRRAAHLMEDPDGSAIVLDEVSAGLLDTRFEVGFNRTCFTLLGERNLLDVGRTVIGKVTPFVGRARELGELEMIFAESVEEASAHAVLAVGPAGSGKSRLAGEFLRRLQRRPPRRPHVWSARADSALKGSPYQVLGQLVRAGLGLAESDLDEAVQAVLRARLARKLTGEDLTRVTVFLGELVGCPFDTVDFAPLAAARRDARVMRDQLRWAWMDWLRIHLDGAPVLIIVDDMHWCDVTSARLLEEGLRELREEALTVLALARPDVEHSLPNIVRSEAFSLLRVRPLSRRAREKLIIEILGDSMDRERRAEVVARSEGNPFLLEELIRAAAEGRNEASDTAVAMVQARLDRLDFQARQLLRAASIYGETFSLAAVLNLLGAAEVNARIEESLELLCKSECIVLKSRGARGGERIYTFRHALIRDAAYRSLTGSDRRIGHGLAGDWLQRRGDRDPMLLARHFERGDDPRRAVRWLIEAARRALEADDLSAVHDRASRAASCGADRGEKAVLDSLQSEAFMWDGNNAACVAAGLRAMRRLERGSSGWCRAVGSAAVSAARMGKRRILALLGRELLETGVIQNRGDEHVWLAVRVSLQLRYVGETALAELLLGQAGELAASLKTPMRRLVESYCDGGGIDANLKPNRYAIQIETFRDLGDRFRSAQACINYGFALITVGAYEEARTALLGALDEGRRMRSSVLIHHAQNNLGLCLYRLGQLEEAARLERAALAWFHETEDKRLEAVTRIYLSLILTAAGDLDSGEREANLAVEITRCVPFMRAFALASQAQVLWRRGRPDEARRAAEEASSIPVEDIEEGEELVSLMCAEVLYAAGETDRARAVVGAAARRVQYKASEIRDPEQRRLFTTRVHENARISALARSWEEERDRTL